MSLIDLAIAREHLRVESDYPESQVAIYLNAAERLVAEFLNRRIYADADTLAADIAANPAAITAFRAAYDAATDAAAALEDADAQYEALQHARRVYAAAKASAREIYDGIVVNEALKAAILLTMTSLHENRGDESAPAALPRAAIELAFPFRVGMGV